MATLLEMKNIRKSFPGMLALDNVSFDLHEGEVHALLGENGAGKSTLMNILFGLYKKDAGIIRVKGQSRELGTPDASYEAGIRLIPQELNLIPTLSVEENIFAGHLPCNQFGIVDKKRMRADARSVLEELGLSHFDLRQKAGELSVSQQQMIAIARAFQQSPLIVVFDEPTSALSKEETTKLFAMIRRLKEQKKGIVYITHRLEEVMEIADRITILRDGKVAGSALTSEVSLRWIMDVMTGLSEDERYPKLPHDRTEDIVLDVRNLFLDGRLSNVSFKAFAGEILGITGFVGAGKTELSQVLFGVQKPNQGEVYVDGIKLDKYSVPYAISRKVALIPEDRRNEGLITSRSIVENLTLPTINEFCSKPGFINRRKENQIADQYIGRMKIVTTGRHKKVRYLSGGNQQKVVISKWLHAGARLFIFDEATRGIDVGAKSEIYKLMTELAAQGAAVINISMEFQEILGTSDRVLVMHEGKIVANLPVEEVSIDSLYRHAGGEMDE